MTALLIDDERLARVDLRRLLKAHPEIEIVAEAGNVAEGLQAIAQHNPGIVFLDIQMPGGSGFDLLAQLDSVPFVVFTTAYDEHALRAFEVSALDYLLKPIAPERLSLAISKAMLATRASAASAGSAQVAFPQRVFVKDGDRCWFLRIDEIILFEADGNYTRLFFGSQSCMIFRSLNYLEKSLDPRVFFRASRKHIVNLRAIKSVGVAVNGGLQVTLNTGMEVEMSRRQSQAFRKDLEL